MMALFFLICFILFGVFLFASPPFGTSRSCRGLQLRAAAMVAVSAARWSSGREVQQVGAGGVGRKVLAVPCEW